MKRVKRTRGVDPEDITAKSLTRPDFGSTVESASLENRKTDFFKIIMVMIIIVKLVIGESTNMVAIRGGVATGEK